MKRLTKLSLHDLSQAELAKKEQDLIRGGSNCGCIGICPCLYSGPQENDNDSFYGGSSQFANEDANVTQNGNSVKTS